MLTIATPATESFEVRLRRPTLPPHVQNLRPVAVPALYNIVWAHILLQRECPYPPGMPSRSHADALQCLCTWFVNNKARKTCPDCRAVVTQPPAPAYVVSLAGLQ